MDSLTPNVSPLRQRMIEDMRTREMGGKTQIAMFCSPNSLPIRCWPMSNGIERPNVVSCGQSRALMPQRSPWENWLRFDRFPTIMSPSDPTPALAVQMETGAFGGTYSRFAAAIGAEHWHDHVRQMEAAIKGCPTLKQFLRSENQIAYALDLFGNALAQHGQCALPTDAVCLLYPAMSFAKQVLSMMDLYGLQKGDEFRRRAADALCNPDAMRGLRLEITTATHFQRRGHTPEWPEQSGTGTFDLLLPSLGSLGLEVECKAISEDKGRVVHIEDALRFIDLLIKRDVYVGVDTGIAVTLTLPNRMPTSHVQREALADAVREQIKLRASAQLADRTDIQIAEFDKSRIVGFNPANAAASRDLIQDVTGTDNRHGVMIGSDAGGVVAFAVQSQRDDKMLTSTFDTLKDAAKRQLTKARPGLVIAGLGTINANQLQSIVAQDHDPNQPPTGLAVHVSQFLASPKREHVIGAAFMSGGTLTPRVDGSVDSGGLTYYFHNNRSRLWSEDFRGIFGSVAS